MTKYIVGGLVLVVAFLVYPFIRGPIEPRQPKLMTTVMLGQVETALWGYEQDCGKFPDQSEGINALVAQNGYCPGKKMRSPYLTGRFPVDGWGKPFVYINDGKKIRVGTNEEQIKAGHEFYFECEIESRQCKDSF